MNLRALWREPSTKRGIVMFITGGVVVYQTVFGDGVIDVSGVESKIERWIGWGLMIAGMLGWLPDAPAKRGDDGLPPIEFQGRPERVAFQRDRDPDDDADQRVSARTVDVPAERSTEYRPPVRPDPSDGGSGWNG